MSKNEVKKTHSREEKKKLAVRIVAMVLAILMVGSMAYYTIYILTSAVKASDTETVQVVNTSSLKNSEDVLVSVGLMYGDNVTTGFQCTSTEGYTIGSQYLDGDKEFEELWDIYDSVISCTSDANLSKTGMTYLITDRKSNTVIGGYHIQVDCGRYDREDVEDIISDTERDVLRLGLYTIPSYIYSEYALRIGAFSSYEEAERYLDDVEEIFDDYYVSIVSPTDTAVSVLNPETDVILFEYDCGGDCELGLAAHTDENGNTYIQTPAKNLYDGVFCFKRYIDGDTDGVSLINVLPLEAYVAGVLPYETSNSWPIETLKAFAITVRSYTLAHLNKHNSNNFDLCNTTHCEVTKVREKLMKIS